MDATKPWWSSKTIIASLAGGVVTVLSIFGIDIGGEEAVNEIVTAVAIVVAIIGRVIATKELSRR